MHLVDSAKNSPDHGYFHDAATHLDSYRLIQSDADTLNKGTLGDEWRSSATSFTLGTFWNALSGYIKKHNKRVEEFSIWEFGSFENMANSASLRVNYSETQGTGVPLETLDARNLVQHMDNQSVLRKRSLELVKLEIEPIGWFLYSNAVGTRGEGKDFQIAWSEKRENVERLKQSIEEFAPERAEQIETLNESVRQVEIGYEVLVRNLQILVEEMDGGIFRGRCETEDRMIER